MDTSALLATLERLEAMSGRAEARGHALLQQLSSVSDSLSLASGTAEAIGKFDDTDLRPLLEDLSVAAANIAHLPDTLRATGNEFHGAIAEFQETIEEFAGLAGTYENAREQLTALAEDCGLRLAETTEATEEALSDAVTDLKEQAEELIASDLEAPAVDLAQSTAERLAVAVGRLTVEAEVAQEAGDAAVARIIEQLREGAIKEAEQVVVAELRQLGEAIIENTLTQVTDDMQLTMISAQISTALSAQLPNLIIARNLTSAVKRALELLRSGGL